MTIDKFKIKVERPKIRRVTPAHAQTRIERDKSAYSRKEKYSSINSIRNEEDRDV